jgi:ankyrin repeat protein
MRTPLSIAAATATALLLATAPLRAQDAQSALWDASISGDTVALAQALADGAKIDSLDTRRSQNGRRALNWAAYNNHAAAVRILLEKGAPIEAKNLTGFTALHHAAEAGSLEAAEVLIAAGAKLDTTNRHGATPIETAREQGHPTLVAALEKAAAAKQ